MEVFINKFNGKKKFNNIPTKPKINIPKIIEIVGSI